MRTMKRQIALLSVLMVLIIAALTLGGLQLFGKGKAKPSEWFKKADKPQVEQTEQEKPETENAALLAASPTSTQAEITYKARLNASGVGIGRVYREGNMVDSPNQPFTMALGGVSQSFMYSFSSTFSPMWNDTKYTNVSAAGLRFTFDFMQGSEINCSVYFDYYKKDFAGDYSDSTDPSLNIATDSNGLKFEILKSVETEITQDTYEKLCLSEVADISCKVYATYIFQIPSSGGYGAIDSTKQQLTYMTQSYGGSGAFVYQQGTTYRRTYGFISFAPLVLPDDPIKEGYNFVGWYYGNESAHGANCIPYLNEAIYSDTALHAHFEIKQFTVEYNTAGGTLVDSEVLNWNTAATCPETYRTGYDFVGWFTVEGEEYDGSGIKADTTLVAHWDIKILKVTFIVDGEEYKAVNVEYGTQLIKAMEKAEIADYRALDVQGLRMSKETVILEDTEVIAEELSGWEKYGDFVARNQWYTWTLVGIGGVLLILAVVGIVEMVRKR